MTRFILHGGATSKPVIGNKRFFAEMVKSSPEPVKILTVYFASTYGKARLLELFEDDKKKFSSASPKKKLEFTMASDNTDTFVNQVLSADTIYIRGGSTLLLKKRLKKVKNLSELLQDKVVGGSSAGAYVLAKYYYTNDRDRVEKGFGILPIKVFCHYSKEKAEKLKKLREYGEDLKVYTIPEAKYCVMNQD